MATDNDLCTACNGTGLQDQFTLCPVCGGTPSAKAREALKSDGEETPGVDVAAEPDEVEPPAEADVVDEVPASKASK